jgi:hypothetical protein
MTLRKMKNLLKSSRQQKAVESILLEIIAKGPSSRTTWESLTTFSKLFLLFCSFHSHLKGCQPKKLFTAGFLHRATV